MTATAAAPVPTDLDDPRRPHPVLTVAVGGGVVLGVVDLLLQIALPYPWANLANSSAVWALAALAFGVWAGRGPVRAAVGGGAMLVVAVAAYYLAATVVLGDDLAVLWRPSSLLWMLFGAISGPAFAAAGSLAHRGGWWRAVAAAGAGAICFAEYVLLLVRYDAAVGGSEPELAATAVLTAVIGLATLVATARSLALVGRALLLAVPFTALAYVGFSLAGFGG